MQHITCDEKWTFRRGMLDSLGMMESDPGVVVNLPHDGMISLPVMIPDIFPETPATTPKWYSFLRSGLTIALVCSLTAP